jgi:hypothetical protein
LINQFPPENFALTTEQQFLLENLRRSLPNANPVDKDQMLLDLARSVLIKDNLLKGAIAIKFGINREQ